MNIINYVIPIAFCLVFAFLVWKLAVVTDQMVDSM